VSQRVVVITGAARGIGLAIAHRFATAGDRVVAVDRDRVALEAADLNGVDRRVCDVASDASVRDLAASVIADYGRADVLVNNAGIASEIDPKPFREIPLDEWRRIFEVNVYGIVRCCSAFVPALERSQGAIVNLASAAALKGVPFELHYTSSKGAVIAMTRSLARELGPSGIRVNAVAPGFALTTVNQSQVAQMGDAAVRARAIPREMFACDVVGPVFYCASEDARFMTGQTIVVDGGTIFL
jgi:NAD(P)-dependent dehydrogenase (short-subunit alcohol dehydrogenase family)